MRENRLSGLEGGVAFGPSLPLSVVLLPSCLPALLQFRHWGKGRLKRVNRGPISAGGMLGPDFLHFVRFFLCYL